MKRLVEVCDELNITKSEVVLELDFHPDGSGRAPALRPSPDFEVKAARGYFEGDRPNEPDWFYKHVDEETYKSNVKNVIAGLKDQYSRMTENHLLCFVRQLGGFTSVYKLQMLPGDGSGIQMFGEEALKTFRCAIKDEKYWPLRDLFGDRVAAQARRQYG